MGSTDLKRGLKFTGAGALALLVLLSAAVAVNTLRNGSRQLQVRPAPPLALNEQAAAARLAAALKFRTIADADAPEASADQFALLQDYLVQAYPRLHAALRREVVGHSLLYTWQGSDPAAKPILWMAHQDVVPIAPGTGKDWQQQPFGGVVQDGFIWGRGSWDDKGNLFAQMEAVELLLASGFVPRQTVYLAYGADEEVGGPRGAARLAALLKSRKVHLGYVLDEGMMVTEGILKGLTQPAALVGVAEKGYATVNMDLSVAPGHSSDPPAHTAIGMMSEAIARLEEHQLPAEMNGVARDMFATIAPEMTGFNRVALSNLWLFGPLVRHQLEQSSATAAMLRTTTAPTIINAGNKDNVLPGNANASINFRLRPGDSVQNVLQHVRETVANDAIRIRTSGVTMEPSPVSRTDAPSYLAIARTVREVFPGAVVAPALVVGATDSRYYADLSDDVYKFSPVRAGPTDIPRFHGTNERIAIKNYAEMIRFYHRLLQNNGQS